MAITNPFLDAYLAYTTNCGGQPMGKSVFHPSQAGLVLIHQLEGSKTWLSWAANLNQELDIGERAEPSIGDRSCGATDHYRMCGTRRRLHDGYSLVLCLELSPVLPSYLATFCFFFSEMAWDTF